MDGVWRHLATGNRYLVLGLSTDSNNVAPRQEPQVVYVSIDFGQGGTDWPFHNRDLPEFLERFRKITEIPGDL